MLKWFPRSIENATVNFSLKEVNMKKTLALLLAVSGYAAFADCGISLGNSNMYVGMGAGAGWNDMSAPDLALRLDGGYNFNEFLALEVGFLNMSQSGGAINQNVLWTDLSVKGTLPLGDYFALFLQLGGAMGSPGVATFPSWTPGNSYSLTNAQNTAWAGMWGAGVQFNFTKQFSINLTDYGYYGSVNALGFTNAVLVGLKYNF